MFKGEYSHSIDTKGRVIVPAKFRELLGDSFVVTKGFDGCLYGYDNEEWEQFEAKLSELPDLNKESRNMRRFFLSGAADCEVDKQGRILLPANLREYAALEKDVVIVGVAKRIEIWDKDRWNGVTEFYDNSMDEIAEHLDSLGIKL